MFSLKKIVQPFVLPPGLFVVILIFTGSWLIFRKRNKIGLLPIIVGAALWILSISPISNSLLNPLENSYDNSVEPAGDVIILLCGGVSHDVPDLTGIGFPSENMLGRIVTAKRLHERLRIPVIISGGSVYGGKPPEAPIVKRIMVDLGTAEDQILIENRSRDTYENAKFSKEICSKMGFKRPILLTSAYHLKRSLMSFERAGLKVTPFASHFISKGSHRYSWYSFLPGINAFKNSARALHEYLGLLYYKIAY